jgi:hypothetical protein
MALVPLVTVADEGAAGVVSAALADAGIDADVRPVAQEHPFQASALARPLRISVEEDQIGEARKVLARVEHEMTEEADAQGAAAAIAAAGEGVIGKGPSKNGGGGPRFSWALAIAFLVPLPVVCFYTRAFRTGALFLGLFLVALGYSFAGGAWEVQVLGGPAPVRAPSDQDEERDQDLADRRGTIFALAGAAKIGDLAVGLATIALGRRRP